MGAYAFINDLVYLETTVYHSLDPNTLNSLGSDRFNTGVGRFDYAPYWRLAFEAALGTQLARNRHVRHDGQYQSVGQSGYRRYLVFHSDRQIHGYRRRYAIPVSRRQLLATLRGSWIDEYQKLDASFFNTLSGNPANELNEARAYASLAYGNDNRIVLTGQYFNSWGNSDSILYAANANFSPNTNGWIAEIAYIPFISSQAPGWPWFNARIGLQYTWYTEFNGTSVGASANNSLYLYLWMAM